jgi:phosphohistidine swiveling domain-containing protein
MTAKESPMLHDAYDLSFYEYDDSKDLESCGVLLCDVVHGRPPMKPLYMSIGWYWYYHGLRYAADQLQIPTNHGWDSRFVNGYPYITTIRTTAEERQRREPLFRERIRPFIENFDEVWDGNKAELIALYREAKESRNLRSWSDIRSLSNSDLLSFFLDFTNEGNRREAEIHMIMMEAAYYINGLFQRMWKDAFGVDAPIDPEFAKVMSGFESQNVKIVRELWRLARSVVETGLSNAFQNDSDAGVIQSLRATAEGREWLSRYEAFLWTHGWRCKRMHAYDTPAWVEDPTQALAEIRMLMREEEVPQEAAYRRVSEERVNAEVRVLERVPAGQKAGFELLMRAAQRSGYWSEDHGYYCDLYVGALGRWIVTEFGRRFAQAGCIDQADDVHFLHANEFRKAAVPMGRVDLRPYVARRKAAWEKNLHAEPAPFLGDIGQAQDVLQSDPTLSVSSQVPIVRKELQADLYGAASAPGVAEGIARVIMESDRLREVQPGEILVAPGTSPSWTVVFSIIKGLITDGGGALSHPVIQAREAGLPCVAGCVEATQRIKTGMRVRVDGNRGVVYLVS